MSITEQREMQELRATDATGQPAVAAPVCPHFGVCGGCRYLDKSYEEQLALKEKEVRNLLQHRERINGSFAVVPSDAMLALLRDVIRDIEGIPCASDLGVKASGLFSAQVDDRIVPVMEVMHKRSFNLVPILNDGRVVGAFSQKTLFSYLMENGVVGFDPNDRLILLAHLLPLDAHGAETFRFVAADAPAPKVAEVFRDALRRSELMGAVFVTAHGKSDERLLSMITSWDMAAFF